MTECRRNCPQLDAESDKTTPNSALNPGFTGIFLAYSSQQFTKLSREGSVAVKEKSFSRSQSGFTLVEIAIVLVIIGLLLGGILKGQEMITQAKIKNIVNDFNGLSAAMYSYQDRYRAIPGDDRTANSRWAGSAKGDGNGIIQGAYNATISAAPSDTQETNSFWWHLRLAGFVPGATSGAAAGTQPNNAANGIVGVQNGAMGFVSNVICTSNLPDKIAIAVDSQMDDGAAASGQVRAQLQAAANEAAVASAASLTYAETGQNQYLLCKNL
jgi:prepilin-type N-terminal cleavage/methylation domain-containing protein